MCGIAGFCNIQRGWYEHIQSMNNAQISRGPDNNGIWSNEDKTVVFGHRRLSILDLSDNGNQPMISHDKRFVICFNGEIYNYKTIGELIGLDDKMSLSDTRVLVEAFNKWGIKKTLLNIKGMFSIALYDRDKNVVYLMRDRMGEKPLYYGKVAGGFVFASTINAIRANDFVANNIDLNALSLYFRGGYIPSPYSIYKDIYKLGAGEILEYKVKVNEFNIWKYWDLNEIARKKELFTGTYVQAKSELHNLLKKSVRDQMVADVPIGVMLSSGIDSSLITALMSEQSIGKVKSFSIGFESNSLKNEAPFAKKIANHIGTDHTELILSDGDAAELIPSMPSIFGEPFGDISQIPTCLVSRLAKRSVSVALTGDAADELFCGYLSYPKFRKLWQILHLMPGFARSLCGKYVENMANLRKKTRLELYGHLMQASSIEDMYRRYFVYGNYSDQIINKNEENLLDVLDNYPSNNLKDSIESIMLLDQKMYLVDNNLTKVDRSAMSVSLETRVPFLDKDIVEFSWTLPLSYKLEKGISKRILKDILFEYVPKNLVDLPKRGFTIPIHIWLRSGKLRDWAEDLFSSANLANYGYLNADIIQQMWKQFIDEGFWNKRIWYSLMYLQWDLNNYLPNLPDSREETKF